MRRVRLIAVGKLREPGLRALVDDYLRRCRGTLDIHEREVRELAQVESLLISRCGSRAATWLVVLDERGDQWTSRELARNLSGWLDGRHAELTFVVGGADGVGQKLRERADVLLSLSKLTLAHQLARVVLAEQLYRAVSILEGSPYHRD